MKKKNSEFFASMRVESISEPAILDEIQLHFALWTWKPQFGWEDMLESEKADAAFQVCHSLFKYIAQ